MFIECNKCNLVLEAENHCEMHIGQYEILALLECPKCTSPLLGYSHLEIVERGDDYQDNSEPEFITATRVWPDPKDNQLNLSNDIPVNVKKALSEAKICYEAQAYASTAVMCGKAIEAICKDKVGPKVTIAKGLEKMKDDGLIDEKIFNWATVLRKERNLGAHATDYDTKESDAKDILAFAVAIADYVYILAVKYNEYMLRKGSHNEI